MYLDPFKYGVMLGIHVSSTFETISFTFGWMDFMHSTTSLHFSREFVSRNVEDNGEMFYTFYTWMSQEVRIKG